MRAFQSCCLLLALLGLCSQLTPSLAHALGRQRSMRTTATATGAAGSPFDMPIWKAAYAGQYVEAAIERSRTANAAAHYQQQSSSPVGQEAAARSLDYQDVAELSPAALQEWMLLTALPQVEGSKLVLLNPADQEAQSAAANEARFIKSKDDVKIVLMIPMQPAVNNSVTSINNNNNTNIIPTPAPAAAAAAAAAAPVRVVYEPLPSAYRSPPALPYGLPLQYMGQRQEATGSLPAAPYGLLGYGSNFAGMPLVPITLPNNEVRYVPLNWRALRQLSASAAAVREDEPQTAVDSADSMAGLAGEAAAAAELSGLNLFQARPSTYRATNPFVTFAKSLRRRQYA